MPPPPCTDVALHRFFTRDNLLNTAPIDAVFSFGKASTSGQIVSAIQISHNGVLNTSSSFQIVLQGGPGPVYTNGPILAQLTGASPTGAEAITSVSSTAVVPAFGRPFDWQIDRFHFTGNWTWATTPPNTSQSVSFDVCGSSVFANDCCAETLAKLDEILGFVSRTWPVVPA